MKEQSADPLAEYRKVNVNLTRWIMQMAAEQGVKQFIYISTAKVNGEWNQRNPDGSVKPIQEPVTSVPSDAYALSKWEAEAEVRKISTSGGIAFTIIRPPLVYGPEVGANFLRLIRLVERGIPLPFASVHNKRSMVFVDNLVDSIMTSVLNPRAYGETFLVDDGTPLSTPQLIDQIARRMGRKPRLFRFPMAILEQCGRAIGFQKILQKVTGSFYIDGTKIRRKLGWTPPLTYEEGLQLTLDWYQSKKL
jgi:nucleoside-diphosphate-sugar epimerase